MVEIIYLHLNKPFQYTETTWHHYYDCDGRLKLDKNKFYIMIIKPFKYHFWTAQWLTCGTSLLATGHDIYSSVMQIPYVLHMYTVIMC